MSSDFYSRDDLVERGPIPLDIDNVHMLLQVEQEQIQKKTFTNWVNAQLAKRRPPCMVLDLFSDFRDGSKLLDLLEVMSGQRISRERGKGMFQHRSNIEKALSFLKQKSIKLVNIHIPDIMDGKPSIILGVIWTIILQYHIEELASCLSFSSRQSSMESLNTLDSRSTLSSRSASSSPVPPRGSPLHNKFRVSAKKALLLWVREQCHKAGCTLNVKDFKASWRSGVVFLAILYALRPDLVDLSKARTRSNKQNLEEAFRIAERELRIPRLLDPDDVDVRDPDEKSIMTYVAQFLQYSRDLPVPEEEMQTTSDQKAQEVTCWLVQAYDELLEGWNSTEGESYSERYHVFQTFLVSFNEQRRPIMPLLTAMRRTPKLSDEQRALREAWDTLTEKLREYKMELDMSLSAPLDTVARWLLKAEGALAEEEGDPQDHGRAADEAREKQELLKVCLEEMPQQLKTFQSFQNLDEYGNMMVPTDKMDELKRRFTSVRVSAKYHGIRLEYREHRHTVLDLLGQIKTKLRVWKRPYISPEAVRVLLQEWHELSNTQELPSLLEAALHKLKQISEKYSSKSALAGDYNQVSQQVKQLEEDTAVVLEEVKTTKSTMGRVLSAWDSYSDCHSSLQAWLEQGSVTHSHGHRAEVRPESLAEWGSRQAHLNEVGNFLIESTDPQTSRSLAEELRRLNMHWAEFVKRNTFDSTAEPSADVQFRPQDIQTMIKEATLILKEPVEAMAGPLRTYRKRIQFLMRKIKEVDLGALAPSQEFPLDQFQKVKLAVPEVMKTLFEAEQVCAELQHSVSGLDSRLAELLHWETEARELYQLLRASERAKQRGQDPRAKLEGQVVTEEQDLQVMVMTNQKNSPVQYLHASAMQDRVRAAVAQSQSGLPPLGHQLMLKVKSMLSQCPRLKFILRPCSLKSKSIQWSRPKPIPSPLPILKAMLFLCILRVLLKSHLTHKATPRVSLHPSSGQPNRSHNTRPLPSRGIQVPNHTPSKRVKLNILRLIQQAKTIPISQVGVLLQSQAESPDLCIKPPALAQAPPQAYTEAYAKAQALARNGFEEAKHCLQEHIMETINVFQDKRVSAEQASVKEETLRTLDPELLEEFLRAAEGMEAFCTPAELRDMEFYTQSVRTQWEACISEDASFAQAGQHLQALKDLCDTLSPEDAHRLAQTQLRECENRLAAIQRQFSGDQDAPLPDSRIPVSFSEELNTQKEPTRPSDKPQVSTEVAPVKLKTVSVERKEVEKQTSVEEEVPKKEAVERYENSKKTLQAQLAKNEQSIKDVPSDSVSLKGLHTRLQEIQFLRQETESLWSDYANQCFQCGNPGLEQEKAELQEQWRSQQSNLQKRGSSLGAALRQIDSTENHMVDFTDRLDRYLRQPKDITGFTLANTNILKDIKELDDNIQSELDQLSRLDAESSDLGPRDCPPLSRVVETHKASLDQLRQQVRKSEASARALDRFLMSMRTVDEDISGVQGAPCSDSQVLQDCRTKLALIRQSIDSLQEKAPQLDQLLQGARLTVTRDGVPASCLDMVTALLRRLEEADSGLAGQQMGLQKETQSRSLGLRKRTLLGELRKLQETIESQGLKEPTMPAVQQRLRALSDCESQVQSLHKELQTLRELQEKEGGGEDLFQDLESQWKETQRAFVDGKKQYNLLLENLKKFQSCRSHLSNTMQRAEQAISDQASYMGKENLQRSITKVGDVKEELAGLGAPMEEMRGACRQLQNQMKKFPDCSQASFEAEADTLMDNWLDVTEKTDAYIDNLRVGLELWEKQLMVGGEVDGWAGAKLALFAESHPFHNEQQVLAMRDEINANEENVELFHKKSAEIQEMLQGQEAPLELQVMETQLRKRMQQVKELFTDCTDVFEELVAVKMHLAEKMEECQAAVEGIQCSLGNLDASQPKDEKEIQDLSHELDSQEEQSEAVMKEVVLVSSVASPQVLESLSVDCSRLREAISRTKDMIHLKEKRGTKACSRSSKCFLKAKDAEKRLEQLKDQLERGSRKVPPQHLSEFSDWLKEQQEEVGTFRTHCLNRQAQMESLLSDLSSLQKQHDTFRDWLQKKEKQSVGSDKAKVLLKELEDESGRADSLRDCLAALRKQCVRAESLLKDGDNLLQRYRNLKARLQKQVDSQSALEGEHDKFSTQAKSTKTWIADLLQPLTSPSKDTKKEELKNKAQAILSSKPEGDSKVNDLRKQSQSLCESEDLEEDRKQDIQQSVRETEEQWRSALQTAEQAVDKAETQAVLEKDFDTFKAKTEEVQMWIRDQEQNLKSIGGCMKVEEKLPIAQAALNSKPDGDAKLQDLKQLCQILCDSQGLDESRRPEVQDAIRNTEEQWKKVLHAAQDALDKTGTEVAAQRDFDAFKSQCESVQSWIKEPKQKLLSLGSHMPFEERLKVAQAIMTSKPEGDSKVLDLKKQGESLSEHLEESRKPEVHHLVKDAEQQWRNVLQAARQAELRGLSDDFDSQSKNTQSWIRDKQQKLQSAGSHTPAEERTRTAQSILSCKPDGDCKVNNLRRRGQSLCNHQDADQGRKKHVQQTVKDTEEQWRTILQAAKQVEDAAGADITKKTEKVKSELREFDTSQQDTGRWLTDFQQQVDSLNSQTKAEDKLHAAQAIISSKPEGDSKLQELKRRGQSVCAQDLEENKKQEVRQKVQGSEEQWTRVLQNAKQALDQAERQCAVEGQLKEYEALKKKTRAWLENKRKSLDSVDSQTDPEKTIITAQTILSSKPEGDSKLSELRRLSQSLSDQEDLEENTRREAQQTVKQSEEQWKTVLQSAESTLKKAEVQYSLSRELEAFGTQAESTKSWVEELQKQAKSLGSGTQGNRAQLEDRLNKAQVILSSKSNGDSQVTELKRRVQSLCEQKDLEGDKKKEVQRKIKDTEQQWRTVMQAAEDTQRQLKGVVDRLVSCENKRSKAEARLADLQRQTSSLPRVFPWPGLGERRQTMEQARTLLDESSALVPVLSGLRKQSAELFEITKDPGLSDPSLAAKEDSIPVMLKELTGVVADREQGIQTERQFTQLAEQHEAAQDWLREHVKALEAPPADRQGLHSAVNNLKALLQTVDREKREMKDLDSARDSLLNLCTPGGRAALTLEVGHLHDLCTTSEKEVRERLVACETRLAELDDQAAKRALGLKERAAALQWELRSLDQALSYSEPQNNIAQLQQHWNSLKNCEKSLEDLGVKVHDLDKEVKATPAADELSAEITTGVESLCQQRDSLKSRLIEHQGTCSTNTARCLMDCLHDLQEWNQSKPSQSSSSAQELVYKTDKVSPTSLQAVQQSSTVTNWGAISLMEGSQPQEKKSQAEASAAKTEKLVLEEPEGSTMRNIFKDIQLHMGTGPSSPLTEESKMKVQGKPTKDAPEGLITSTRDLETRLSRLVCKVLSCKNQPAELNPTAMAQQLEEAQKCRETAEEQVSLLSQMRLADAENTDALQQLEDQWSTAIQDAAAIIQSKEAQLQDVTDYCRQTKAVETTLEKLTAELDVVRTSTEESSLKEAERLSSSQRSMEENRTVLGQMLLAHTKVCPHLSRSERATAQADYKNLQVQWRGLERAVERSLYNINIHSQETSCLLSEISSLQEGLEAISKDIEAKPSSGAPWDCNKAQKLMAANAEVKAAQQKYLHLQKQLQALLLSSHWETETKKIAQDLQRVKDQLCHTEELVSSQTQNSSNPTMEKIIVVMRDGLAWAKQTESDIEGRRKRVAFLPEEVHQQLRDLKKLQSEVLAKQGQLESLVEEVTELLPQLDQAEEVPMVRKSLGSLEELSNSTTDKLAKAVRETESGLQTREKLSEQIADLDSWVVTHLNREATRSVDNELRSPSEFDRRVRQIQATLAEAEKQSAVCEALLMKSKDLASELSITENCRLFDKLTTLQEEIRAISSYEKANKKELDELTETVESSKKELVAIEKSLRQILVDLNRNRFPITRESLQALEPFKQMILEHKSRVDLLQPWIPQEKSKELYSVISELYSKTVTLESRAKDHEGYLNMRQCVEDLREKIEEQVHETKDDRKDPVEKYKVCQTLLVQFPLMRHLSKEAHSKLQLISADLYPSQLNAERLRLKQNEDSNDTLEMMLYNNLSIIEWKLMRELDLDTERQAAVAFLQNTQQELQKHHTLEANDTAIDNEYRRIMYLKKTVESRMRALEVLEQNKGNKQSQYLMVLKKVLLNESDKQMLEISKARESFRNYTDAVRQAVQFLRDIEVSLLPPHGSAGLCSERVEQTQQALASLQQQFQTHIEKLQSQNELHPYVSPQRVEQLQENILSQLLVRMSTLQAKGHVHLDCLSRCAENHRKFTKCQEEIIKTLNSAENSLSQFICQKVTCLAGCTDQQAKLEALSEEVESLQRRLGELKEWCPEQSCCGGREASVTALWKRLARVHRCTLWLKTRSKQRVTEWSQITDSVEKASAVLDRWRRSFLMALGLKPRLRSSRTCCSPGNSTRTGWTANTVPCPHWSCALPGCWVSPPTSSRRLPLLSVRNCRRCRDDTAGKGGQIFTAVPEFVQLRLLSDELVKQRSRQGLESARMELEEREKLREELQGVKVWLEAADGLLSEMEQSRSTKQLQEVHSQLCTQKALLQRIMEGLRMKYSDMYTLVPVDIDGQLKEVTQSLRKVEVKVGEAVERSGPVHRLGAKLSEIQAGLRSVQKRLEQRSPSVAQAKVTQKRVWDELDVWHSCVAALEVDMQDLEKPEETLILTERLVEVQQLHSQLAKQAEQRTTQISKIHMWLQEHQEMIKSSKSWMSEAQTWLAAPCTYTVAKDLSSHVQALKTVLDDSAQIRNTLQGFSSVLNEMSQVCDVTTLQEQLVKADRDVANVQDGFTAPLSQLEHAAAEVEAIESEVRRMENNVAEIKTLLTSPETFPSPREESLKAVEKRIQNMRRTIAEIQKCKPGLCLPEKAEETLVVFTVVDQLQTLLLELEKKVPALFIQQPPTPVQAKAPSTTSPLKFLKSTSNEDEKEDMEQGRIRIAHVEADVLKRSGAALLTVEHSSADQRKSRTTDSTEQREHEGVLQAEEAREKTGSEEQRVEEGGGGVLWWLWDAFLGSSPEEHMVWSPEETDEATELRTEQAEEARQDVETPSDSAEASSSEALSKPVGTVRTQSLPESMVNTTATTTVKVSKAESQQKCVALEEPPRPGPRPAEGVLNACLGRVGQLELWLQKAQWSLVAAGPAASASACGGSMTMQDSLEQQLLICEEMFLEIEQKIAGLSATDSPSDQQQEEPGAVGSQQEAAELLSSKLELLKANLVCFQQLLQERQGEERVTAHKEPQEQKSEHQSERPLESKLKRSSSSSVQEIFSSPKNKLLRQGSLQQQKELEQELTEQRGLTRAIARQGSRGRLYSQETEEHSPPSPRRPPAEPDVNEDPAQKKWDRLHSRLLAVEESFLLPPSESLSTEMETLGNELASQGPKVARALGSECVQQCVDDVCRVLPVVQAALSCSEKQLRKLQEETAKQQTVTQMQESLQQQVEQVSSLLEVTDRHNLAAPQIQQAKRLQGELDRSLGGVRSCCDELKSSVELQQQYERLVHSLEELIALGSGRLSQQPDTELHDRAQLQQQLSSHTMWSQWEEDSAWSDSLLRGIETSLPKLLAGADSEEQVSEKLSVFQEQRLVLDANKARLSQMLEKGTWLHEVGCRGVEASTRKLDSRWKVLQKRVEHERIDVDRKRKLRNRFLRDSAALAEWMGGARDMIDTSSANEEMDVEQRRDYYLQFMALTKELEAKSELKVAVIGAGTRLVNLRETDEGSDRNPEDRETADQDLCSIQSQLRQVELDWSSLLADVPVTQQALHKRWMKTLSQQGALLELQSWLEAAECRLEEHRSRINQTSSLNTDLSQLLKYCKECQAEMSAHQATLDFVNPPLQTCITEAGQRGRYVHNQFADEQGRLNHQWLSLKETLNSQIAEVEQELRSRVEREARLQQINSWIADQNLWIQSAQTPSSRTELQRSINTCQDLEDEIRQKSEALHELRDKLDGGVKSCCDFISQIEKSIQRCAALMQQKDSMKQKLTDAQRLWDCAAKQLNQMTLKAVRTSQTLEYHSSPQLCLQAHRDVHEKLQVLHEETEASTAQWDELNQTVSSLKDVINPPAAIFLTERLDTQRDSWSVVSGELDQKLQKSGRVLQAWELYARLAASFSQRLQTLQSEEKSALRGASTDDNTAEKVTMTIQNVQSLQQRTISLQSDLEGVLEASKDLIGRLEPSAAALVQSESRLLSRGVQQLALSLTGKLGQLQEELDRLQEFGHALESLERKLELWQERLQDVAQTADQSGLLELSGLSADLDVLNELSRSLTLGDAAARRLQRLNHCWVDASARAEEACSELQNEALKRQSFEQKCESWMSFLQRMEDSLAVDVAGSYMGLRQQLCTHKHFQTELSIGHQILHSVITEALHLLQKGEVEDRSDFILKLAQLREHWQGAVQRADQRRSLVEGLVKHWHLYSRSLKKLQKFLSDTQTLLPPAGPARCSLQQLRRSLQDLQHTELLFQRYQSSFIHTLEVGRQLFSMGNEETQTQLQSDLGTLQEEWDNLHSLLGRRMDLTEAIIKNWERCESGLAGSMLQLKDMKTRLNQSMPECDDELQSAEKFYKENEDSLEDWAESLTELSTMKTDLSQYIIADDVLLLQEQVEYLHCQWEELCLKVSLRKQEIADRLNAWIIFNEKNKELCEWLTQMENKVAHNSDLNIEEMVEKLKKDCMEEINLFSENKTHLKQLGEQLITASNKTKETEINDKLKDINDRWQHLFDHIEARVRKLKETLVTVQQLDKNMSNLRTWLSRIEAELAKPLVYNVCHSDEIQKKLAEQQDLQRDIEQHTESVASVLTLCDVLLHDADACGGDSENDSIQQTTRSLDRRWRNICAMSMERRMRIEETWRLWCKFLDDFSRFEDWLKSAELTAASPDSADVLYTSAKEELKKFEAFQRQVHERLTQLELVNKQYRRLARENRTDAASKLKVMVHEGNQRWDSLQRRVAAVLRRIKHFTSQREDFEGTREGILVWLTEMDLQLTNVEHFSESDIEDKMRQLNGFQQEITLNTNKIDALIVFGENLIQKSAPLDAVLIEDELEELHSYCQEVFGRVARFHNRLVNRRPILEEERELSDRDTDHDDSPDLTNGTSWSESGRKKEGEEEVPAGGGVSAGRQAMCHLLAPPLERSGRETPVSVDSIPLEWDHTVDVGGSSSHEEDEDATFFSALSDVKVTESSESFVKATVRAVRAASVKSVTDPPSWHQPASPERKRVPREILRGLNSSPTHTTSTPFHQQGYAKLMSECSGSINTVKRVKLILNDEVELDDPGLTSSTADKQTSVIERWELLQAPKFNKETDIKQDLEQWQKLNSDLSDVTSWLGRVLPELERLQRIAPSTSIRDIEVNIRKLKEMQKTFNSYKCLMISVNLSNRHFLRGDSAELRELQDALSSANHSWTQACGGLESWERRLHSALMQCQEFHETLHSLLLWLAQAENKLSAVNVNDLSISHLVLLVHQKSLKALQEELRGRQRQVSSLQEISSQLLLEATEEDSIEAKEKVHVIYNKLCLLLRQVAADLHTLQGRLETCSTSSEMDSIGLGTLSSPLLLHKEEAGLQAATVGLPATRREERRDSSPHRPLFYRVLRAAFPLHLLFLVLLVLACLVPLSEEDYSCTLSNNFARSFYPMLRYTNGPPPT
nr:nesprin-2 [Labrus bergylta]